MSAEATIPCPLCAFHRNDPRWDSTQFPYCGGSNRVNVLRTYPCLVCDGIGSNSTGNMCGNCEGEGRVPSASLKTIYDNSR
jgi:DnaJ-class molecular chaperone